MARTIDLKLSGKEIERLGPKLRATVGRALFSAAIRGVQVIQTQIIPRRVPQPVDRGMYRAGWRSAPIADGESVIGGELWNGEPHAAFVEAGVRAQNVKPGHAMITALAEWARRKGLDGTDTPEGARQVAWAIARAMMRRGIFNKGRGMGILRELMTRRMPAIIREEIRREAGRH